MGRDGELKPLSLEVGYKYVFRLFVLVGESPPPPVGSVKLVGSVKVGVLPLRVRPLSVVIVDPVPPELAYGKAE